MFFQLYHNVRWQLTPPYLGFVNAQYRFVMDPTGDYTVHFADPDMYVDHSTTVSAGYIIDSYH